MARPAYSKNLIYEHSVTGITALAEPPTGYLWVVRTLMATYGSFAAYAATALGLDEEGPWSWLASNPLGDFFSDHAVTFTWEGRYVVPAGSALYVNVMSGDTCDLKIDGYELSVDGIFP